MKSLTRVGIRIVESTERTIRRRPGLSRRFSLPRVIEPSTTRWFRANREELEAAGLRFTSLPDNRVRRTPLPPCINGDSPKIWSWATEWTPHERFYLEMPRGRLVFEPWRCCHAVLAPGNSILHDAVSVFFHSMKEHPARRSVFFSEPHKLPGRAFLLYNDAAKNFYHWLCDILPRLYVAQCAGHGVEDFDWFITDRILHPFQKETLAALGVPPEKIVVGTEHRLLEAETLCVTSLFDRSGMVHRESLAFVRDALMRHFSIEPKPSRRRKIFISRQQTVARRIDNWTQIEPILLEHDFEIVVTESLSMREQIVLFREASHIVAGHGAGLTNLMFCRPGTRVLEILNEGWGHPMYWLTATKFDLDYAVMLADFVGRRKTEVDDLRVDPDALRSYLEGQRDAGS